MTYEELKSAIALSPSIRLLRAKSAPITISFLYQAFKADNQIAIPSFELTNRLADYIESLGEEDAFDIEITDSLTMARKYIDYWCSEDTRFLTRYPDENGAPIHELTADTEKAFQWIESMQKRDFVGTESRFRHIYQQLEELLDNTSEDAHKRIKELERKKRAINLEIQQIKKTGIVNTYNDTQVKERFYNITKTARELLADFKEVEQNFKEITLNLYKKQTQQHSTKGQILGYTLDATDELKNSDQGKSFYAFWQFLIADNKQDELIQMIELTHQLLKERAIECTDNFLKKIKIYLHHSGQKVIESNHLLADKLSRILIQRDLQERKHIRAILNEIKHLAVEKIGQFDGERNFITIEGTAHIDMTMDRPLGKAPQIAHFNKQAQTIGSQNYANANLGSLFNQFELNKKVLEKKIIQAFQHKKTISLQEVVQQFPIENGLAEIISYFAIASRSSKHQINTKIKEKITWQINKTTKSIELPQVTFVRE